MKGTRETNLCVDSGLDDVDHHVRCDGVGLQVQGSDGFIGLESFGLVLSLSLVNLV